MVLQSPGYKGLYATRVLGYVLRNYGRNKANDVSIYSDSYIG